MGYSQKESPSVAIPHDGTALKVLGVVNGSLQWVANAGPSGATGATGAVGATGATGAYV